MTKAEQNDRVRGLFQRARRMAPHDRDAFLQGEIESEEVMLEVRSLLDVQASDDDFLETPILSNRVCVADFLSFPEEAVPDRIGPYQVVEQLGDGGFARVFRARHDDSPTVDVALKVLRPGFENRRLLARFDLETQALSMLDDPGIARLLHAGVLADRRPYFAMELVRGPAITEYCADSGLARREVLELFMRICAAVEHAHVRGIIHRDLKPSNILVSDIDGRPAPKVIDFGIAKVVEGNSPARWQTTSRGHLIGTLEYMSPEQCAGRGSRVDTRTDVYALGVLLHELLTGKRPFDVADVPLTEAVRIIVEQPAPPISMLDPTLSGDLATIVAHALEKDRARRYQSARELSEDVRLFLHQQPIRARGTNTIYQLRKHAARHKPMVAALSGLLIVLLALLAQGYWGWRNSHRHYLHARQTAEFLLDRVVDDLSERPGQADMRRAILQQVLAQAEPFLLDGKDDLQLDLIHARALGGMGDLEREQGDVDAAQQYRFRALEIHERLAKAHPARPELQAAHSIALVKLGDLAKESGDPETALHWYQRSLNIDESLTRFHADDLTIQDNLAWSYERMAHLAWMRGERDVADRFNQLRLGQVMLLQRLAPEDERVLHNLICVHNILADTAARDSLADLELEHRRQALEVAQRLGGRFPVHRLYQSRLAMASASLSAVELRLGNVDMAGALLTQAVSISKILVQNDKGNIDSRASLAGVLLQLADLHERLGQDAESRECLEDAVGHAEAVHRAKPGDPWLAGLHAGAMERLALINQ